MAKLDKPHILIDDSVVMHGFRALMSGAQLDEFIANPVMLYLHNRTGQYGDQDSILPIGKWTDIHIDGNKLMATAEFDDDDEFAQKIESKVRKGYLNGASIWLDPIDVSDDDSLKMAGQRGPTVTKWGILEASIVDIPNCRNALAIRNSAGNKVLLSGNQPNEDVLSYLQSFVPQNNTMEKKLLAVKLGLAEAAGDDQIAEKLTAVLTQATNATQLAAENTDLKNQIIQLKAAQKQKEVEELVDNAIREGKLTAGEREGYIKLASADLDTVKTLLAAKTAAPTIEAQLGAVSAGDKAQLAELLKLTGEQLYSEGKLETLLSLDKEAFKAKYKEAFGVEYKG